MKRASDSHAVETIDTVVIGGGQAGLSVGRHLARRGVRFVILEGRARVGDVWRERWDSLRLFTPARFCGLDGMPFPASPDTFPTKDEMADYLEAYALRFDLPVLTGTRVDRVSRRGERFRVEAGGRVFDAASVVVAMASYQRPWTPPFARELGPDVVQLHSFEYRHPGQLRDGPVLIVGAGNSGAEIAKELAPRHRVVLSGRDTGKIPFRIDGFLGRLILVRLVLRVLFHRVLTVRTPIGRKARAKMLHVGGPLIRVKSGELARAGVERAAKAVRVEGGRPVLADGRALDVANVVWCTGFRPGFDWIDVPGVGDDPPHRSGVVPAVPGLYFVGLHFLHALSSTMIHGVGRDAERIARAVAARGAQGMGGGAAERPESRTSASGAVRAAL